jgi:hypothetical protein
MQLAPIGVDARDGRTGSLHRKFALHYAQFMNTRQAAIHCGYSPDKAGQAGSRLLKSKKVIAELAKLNVRTQRETVGDIMELREYWTSCFRGDNPNVRDEVQQVKCSELLGKSLGAFIERNESKVQVTLVIEDESANAPPIDVTPRLVDLRDDG